MIDLIVNISIDSWWPVGAVLLVLGLALLVVAVVVAGRPLPRVVVAVLGAVPLLLSGAVATNAYYGYFPTLGEALGGPGPDEDSLAAVEAESDAGRLPATGQVVPIDLPGTTSGFTARTAQVYLPPAWTVQPRPQLPVVMLLHGSPGSPENWTDGGDAQATADAWAAQHDGIAPVLVMPDINGSLTDDSECVDGPVGDVETYLTVDVPTAVVQNFGTKPAGAGWIVAGLSEGGACAIMLALRHPDKYTAFGDFGGLIGPRSGETNADTADTITDLFGGSQQAFQAHEPTTLLTGQRFPELSAWFQVGTGDPDPLAAAQQLVPLARAAGISTCLVTMPDQGHTFVVWAASFRDSLPWMAARLGLVPKSPAQTALCQPAAG